MREEVHTIIDPNTGLPFDARIRTVEDACRDCGGAGVIRFSTFADYRRCIELRRSGPTYWEEPEPEPEESGKRHCERCNGTGEHKGDGGQIRVTFGFTAKLMSLPCEL